MIQVIAAIRVKEGRIAEFLEIFRTVMPSVQAERGCIEYFPAVDLDAGLPPQSLDAQVVTIIEKWESLEALRDHLGAPHMLAYRKQTRDIVEHVSLKILKPA
jgi:quinol monooxygenase YgiN